MGLFGVIKQHRYFVAGAVLIGVTGALLGATWYRYQFNPDAVSYFTIAEKYSHFDFRHAINGYWGPLLSWLLVPAVWLHISLNVAAKDISVLASVIVAMILYVYLIKKGKNIIASTATCLGLGIWLVGMSLTGPISPDILMLLISLALVLTLEKFLTGQLTTQLASALGLLGALLYYTKGFGFFFFITLLVATYGLKSSVNRSVRLNFRPLLIACVVFGTLVTPFIIANSIKYHRLVISNAGAFDHNLFGPAAKGSMYPMLYEGPLNPPNKTAVSVWEDPTLVTPLIPGAGWSPLHSGPELRYFINSVLLHNLNESLNIIIDFGALVIVGTIAYFAGILRRTPDQLKWIYFGLTTLILIGGYSLVYTESRYLLLIAALGSIAFVYLMTELYAKKFMSTLQIAFIAILIIGLYGLGFVQSVEAGKYENASYRQTANTLTPYVPAGSNIISDSFDSIYFCYYLNVHCYSVLNSGNQVPKNYYKSLNGRHITLYIDLGLRPVSAVTKSFIDNYFQKVQAVNVNGEKVIIYKLREINR